MTEEVTQQEQPQVQPQQIRIPIVLNLVEIQAVLTMVRKFPMEQVEHLVANIQTQANTVLEQMSKTEQTETGETK